MARSTQVLVGAVALGLSWGAQAADREYLDSMLEHARETSMEQCSRGELRDCLGISRQECEATVDAIVEACRREVRQAEGNGRQALARCLEEQPAREFGDGERLRACGRAVNRGGGAPSSPGEARAQARAQGERAMERAREGMRRHMEAQGVSRDDITLPVYPDARMVSHLPPGTRIGVVQGEELALAENIAQASLTTSDSAQAVAAFYRERLAEFNEADGGMGADAMFVDGSVPDAMPMSPEWIRAMRGKRSVSITGLDGTTRIQIHYEP